MCPLVKLLNEHDVKQEELTSISSPPHTAFPPLHIKEIRMSTSAICMSVTKNLTQQNSPVAARVKRVNMSTRGQGKRPGLSAKKTRERIRILPCVCSGKSLLAAENVLVTCGLFIIYFHFSSTSQRPIVQSIVHLKKGICHIMFNHYGCESKSSTLGCSISSGESSKVGLEIAAL